MIATLKRSLWVGMGVVLAVSVFLAPIAQANGNNGNNGNANSQNNNQQNQNNNNGSQGNGNPQGNGQNNLPVVIIDTPTTESEKKIVVCKYVDHGLNERLKLGNDGLVIVSENTLNNDKDADWDGSTFPWVWVDNQARSIAIGYDNGQTSADCPAPGQPPVVEPKVTYQWTDVVPSCEVPSVIEVETKTTITYLVTWENGQWVVTEQAPVTVPTGQTRTVSLTQEELEACDDSEEPTPDVATASVEVTPATCTVPETLIYINVANAYATPGSTANNTPGPLQNYSVTFVAEDDAEFASGAQTTFTGSLNGVLTGLENCPEDGDVLGGTTTTPPVTTATPTPSAPAVLPATTGESTAAIVLGGSLLAVVLGFAGARRILARSL